MKFAWMILINITYIESINSFKMKSIILTICAVCTFIVSDYTGTWHYKVATPDGQMVEAAFVISNSEGSYTGVARSDEGELPLNDLKITDDSFSCYIDYMGYRVVFTGKFDGDLLKVTGDVEGFQFPVEAKRKSE